MRRRVLHLLSQRPGWTGSGTGLDAIVRAADRRGWDQAVVVGTSADDPNPSVGLLDRTRVHPLQFGTAQLPFSLPGMSDVMPYPSSRFSELSGDELSRYRACWREHVARVIDQFQPDLIHSHHVWILSCLLKDITTQLPIVVHCHATGLRQLSLCPHLAAEVRLGCSRNDHFFTLHQGHGETLQQELGVSTAQISIIGSGFRQDLFHAENRPPHCGPVVTYAGKLSRAKGLPWLLDAVDRLIAVVPDIELNIAGSGSGAESEGIRNRIAQSKHIRFHGQLDQNGLAELLRRSRVFVLPSMFEGLPLVLVEAAACGCRLVSTALPGVVGQLQPTLQDSLQVISPPRLQHTDQPVEADLPGFVDQLVATIDESLKKPPLQSPIDRVKAWTWDSVFQQIEQVWTRLIDGFGVSAEPGAGR